MTSRKKSAGLLCASQVYPGKQRNSQTSEHPAVGSHHTEYLSRALTDVRKIVQRSLCRAVVNLKGLKGADTLSYIQFLMRYFAHGSGGDLFAVDEQGEAVEQAVDGVSGLVDGQDDGATVVRHPTETSVKFKTLHFPKCVIHFVYRVSIQ